MRPDRIRGQRPRLAVGVHEVEVVVVDGLQLRCRRQQLAGVGEVLIQQLPRNRLSDEVCPQLKDGGLLELDSPVGGRARLLPVVTMPSWIPDAYRWLVPRT